ncbi:MAG TPA: glycosyltransferase family 4 protein [Gaiellales bacterium]|jgi:glycosyltransferase involved in cell wall biosynthesis|nr:glycosyltransferase family 4 protein [Gaiellales bacterium]
MQQVQETGLQPARTLLGARRRSQEFAGRKIRSESLRIAVLAPPWFAVPPRRYGGTEAIVNLLVDGLVGAGHDVTLFASGDSRTDASLVSIFPAARSDDLGLTQPELLHALTCVRDAGRFDVVSDHTGALGLALSNLTSTPFLNTVHGTLAGEAGALYRSVCEVTPGAALVSLTESHRGTASDLPWAATIPNAIALDDHPCRIGRGGEYLFWLGRMSADKGPVTAIEVARAAGMPMLLAGKQRGAAERAYFEAEVQPRLGGGIDYVGEIGQQERVRLLHGARALINPLAWNEPFGLVMVEAMACGVPVIATSRGSVPEIVVHGHTGWIADSVAEMAAAVERCDEIDPRACRAEAELHYAPERMVSDYVDAFHVAIERAGRASPLTHSAPA